MSTADIISAWLKYSDYKPDEKTISFRFGDSVGYEKRKCNDFLPKLQEYDPTGSLAVMYIKSTFTKVTNSFTVRLSDILKNPEGIAGEREMWDILHSQEVTQIQNGFLDSFQRITQQLGAVAIGERDLEKEQQVMFESVDAVATQLSKCNEDLFLRGGMIQPATTFDTNIYIFPSLAQCLLTLETAKDGIYTCFIQYGNSPDGYFGFYIKSNGTLLSINERQNESYPGEHKNHRNARYTEDKALDVFPYNYIFDYSKHDYKGYATHYEIAQEFVSTTDTIDIFKLPPQAYTPLILGMVMINNRYAGADLNRFEQIYIDSLLPVNLRLPTPGTQELMVPNNSALAQVNTEMLMKFTTEGVLNAEYADELNWKNENRNYSETGCFSSTKNIFVELYGNGFHLNADKLLEANSHIKCLTSSELEKSELTANPEFVGTKKRFEVIAYKAAREQLAEYLRDRIYEEFIAYGGAEAVEEWWEKILLASKKKIIELCLQKYEDVATKRECNVVDYFWRDASGNPLAFLSFNECKSGRPDYYANTCPFNAEQGKNKYGYTNRKRICFVTGTLANTFFYFRFNNWKEMAMVFGEENIPKILIGWNKDGHDTHGNSILSATDAVETVGTPFEERERKRNKRYPYFRRDSFGFCVGFSKRGLNQLLKKRGGNQSAE